MPLLRQSFPPCGALLLLLGGIAVSAAETGAEGAKDPGAASATNPRPPATWQQLPELAERARGAAAARSGSEVAVEAQAWGDPATGAFALSATARASGGGTDGAEALASLRSEVERAGAKLTGWTAADDAASFSFEWRAFRGDARVRASIDERDGSLRTALLACFYSERQPIRSAATCKVYLEGFEEEP